MLTTLYNVDRNLAEDLAPREGGSPVGAEKVLCLYESHGRQGPRFPSSP